ncbi:uncharacterized protein PRCAT00003017001 [Priceomyces carsonii]|uniref:uncharacterized protein n=1 Tax=Priceomyces carsonii TaxID=28549 RepID=UPI002ED979CC|nr:unnamed protein product [Priceomyces carsonii]
MPSVANESNAVENPKRESSAEASTPSTTNEAVKEHKRKKLVRKTNDSSAIKLKIWLAGHCITIVFGLISFTFQIFWLPNKFYINSISYRLALVGAIMALTATISHKFGFSFLPPASTLVAQQNFQYLCLAVAWIFTFKSIFKILPYFIISLLQLGSHKHISFVEKESGFLASVIAYNELLLIIYLFLRTLVFRNTSGFQLVLFLVFYWLRILYNKETKTLFMTLVQRLDGRVSSIKNDNVQRVWTRVKQFLKYKQDDPNLKLS